MFALGSQVYDYLLDLNGIVIANPADPTKLKVQFVNPETTKVFTQMYTMDGKQTITHKNPILFSGSIEISPIEYRWRWVCQRLSDNEIFISANWYSDASIEEMKLIENGIKYVEKIEDTKRTFSMSERG